MSKLLKFLSLHCDVRVVRSGADWVQIATPAVQHYGTLHCQCTELSPRLRDVSEAREYLGY